MNDVLDLSKIEANMLKLDRVLFRPAEIADDIRRLFLSSARGKGIQLRVYCNESAAQNVLGDPRRLRQVLTNLVSNAIRFTEAGQVALHLDVMEEDERHVTLRFQVHDTGPGISAHDLELIFEAFEQGDSSTTRSQGGTGLGLTVSRQIVELMGGALEVHSTPNQGSRFSFQLTLDKPSETEMAMAPRHPLTPVTALPKLGLRVLVAEDNDINQMVVERFLAMLGCEWVMYETGRQIVEGYGEEQHDLVLMDCEMPEMDGFQATRAIREMERRLGRAPIPIVAVTAHAMDEAREATVSAGMDDFLSKPFSVDQLREVLQRNTTGRKKESSDHAGYAEHDPQPSA